MQFDTVSACKPFSLPTQFEPMTETFKYDVFISHSFKDKPAARELAERLRRDGLRDWFDYPIVAYNLLITRKEVK